MTGVANFLRNFSRSEDGASAIEYALIATCVSVVIVVAVGVTGEQLNTTFYAKIAEAFN